MAHVAQMLTQEPIYKPSSIFCFKPILLSAHKLILLIYDDNTRKKMVFWNNYCPPPRNIIAQNYRLFGDYFSWDPGGRSYKCSSDHWPITLFFFQFIDYRLVTYAYWLSRSKANGSAAGSLSLTHSDSWNIEGKIHLSRIVADQILGVIGLIGPA